MSSSRENRSSSSEDSSSSSEDSSSTSEGSSSSDSLESGVGKGRTPLSSAQWKKENLPVADRQETSIKKEILQYQPNLSSDSSSDGSDDDRYVPPENGVAAFFAEGATPRPISVDPPDNERLVPVYDANVISSSATFSFKPDFTSKRSLPQQLKPLKNTPVRSTSGDSEEVQNRGLIGAKRERDSTIRCAAGTVSDV